MGKSFKDPWKKFEIKKNKKHQGNSNKSGSRQQQYGEDDYKRDFDDAWSVTKKEIDNDSR
jgi:hypothetical protein